VSSRLGIELGARHLRVVRIDGGLRPSLRTAQFEWDGERLDDAVARVEQELGGAGRIALALDMPLLFAKEIPLPAVPAAEKVGILALEPERYFPVRGEELLLAARGRDQLIFATRESVVAEALAAVSRLGPVERVEPAPHALARALDRLGVRRGTVVIPGAPRGALVVRLDQGEVAGVRWLRGGLDAAAKSLQGDDEGALFVAMPDEESSIGGTVDDASANGVASAFAAARRLPVPRGVTESFLVAYGAALGVDAPPGETLEPPDLTRRIVARRRRRTLAAVAALIGAATFALVSVDRAAAGVATTLTRRADSLSVGAERAFALQAERDALDRRGRAVAALVSGRTDQMAILAALGQRLPADAWLRTIRSSGAEWQVDGYARDAALLVPTLEAAPEFENVRFLTATTTDRVGTRVHESFSIAFRLARRP